MGLLWGSHHVTLLLLEHGRHLSLHKWPLQNLSTGRPSGRLLCQEVRAECLEICREGPRQLELLWDSLENLCHQDWEALRFKRHAQESKLVQHAAKCPHIAGKRIDSLSNNLWAEVQRGAYGATFTQAANWASRSARAPTVAFKNFADAKVTYPKLTLARQEKILALQVPVYDVAAVQILEPQRSLCQPA